MCNQTARLDYGAGLELMRQEYMATLSELATAPGYTAIELLRLRKDLTDEYLLQRSQEHKSIASQMRDDDKVANERM
jgi:hypothetical protein